LQVVDPDGFVQEFESATEEDAEVAAWRIHIRLAGRNGE
jgi:hypothetical protein